MSNLHGAGIVTTSTADKQLATILTDNVVGQAFTLFPLGAIAPARQNCTVSIFYPDIDIVADPADTRVLLSMLRRSP